jgi:hypothetical protein
MNKTKFVLAGIRALLSEQPQLRDRAKEVAFSEDLEKDFPNLKILSRQMIRIWLSLDHSSLIRTYPEVYCFQLETDEEDIFFEDMVEEVMARWEAPQEQHCSLKFY